MDSTAVEDPNNMQLESLPHDCVGINDNPADLQCLPEHENLTKISAPLGCQAAC